jgi:serine/threonine protein kinase
MLNQNKYQPLYVNQSFLTEQSVIVECFNQPSQMAILNSYSANSASQLIELARSQIDKLLSLRHPYLQAIIDVFSEDNSLHIVRELAEGKPIATLVPLGAEDCDKLLKELLEVIAYLHDRDIIHGNISPETIIVDSKHKFILTNFKTISNLISTAKGEIAKSFILDRLSAIPVANIPQGKQFDLYSLGLTAIYLLTDRELEQLYDRTSHQWRWEEYTDCSEKLVTVINRLISSRSIGATEILRKLKPSRSDPPRQNQDPTRFISDSNASTFIDLPNNLNDPVYLQAGILGVIDGSIWMAIYNLLSWDMVVTGVLSMAIGGAIYWRYRSPYDMKQLLIITGFLSILMILIPALSQKLPFFANLEHPKVYEIVLFLIACGIFNFAVFILAGFIYRSLSILINKIMR